MRWRPPRLPPASALSDRELSPTAALQDAIVNALYGDSIRVQPVIPLADIESLDVQHAFDIYKERFADMGDFTFVIVGNFKVEDVTLLAQRYLGTLPSSGRNETWKNLLPALPTGVHEQDIYKGNEDRSTVEIIYPGTIDPTPKNELSLSILQRILDIRLREELRTRLSATYSPSVSQGWISGPSRPIPWPLTLPRLRLAPRSWSMRPSPWPKRCVLASPRT